MSQLSAVALVCTLSSSPEPSSSELMARHVLEALEQHGVATSSVRVVDHDGRPGVQVDVGGGGEWPAPRRAPPGAPTTGSRRPPSRTPRGS